jgi:hypothetical protein
MSVVYGCLCDDGDGSVVTNAQCHQPLNLMEYEYGALVT